MHLIDFAFLAVSHMALWPLDDLDAFLVTSDMHGIDMPDAK